MKNIFFSLVFLLALVGSSSAETVGEYVEACYPGMNETAREILGMMGSMSTWEKLFVDRLATLTPGSQKRYAVRLAIDGRVTQEDLSQLPVAVVLPEDPAGIIALLTEHARADYWTGFYRRHRLSVNMKMRHWEDTAERRYDDPELCKELIRIFFQMVDGKYDGPMTLEYQPASRDIYRAED